MPQVRRLAVRAALLATLAFAALPATAAAATRGWKWG